MLAFSKDKLRFTIAFELPPVFLRCGEGGGGGILMRVSVKSLELVSFFIELSRTLKIIS